MRWNEKFWPALITPFPDNAFPNVLAANVPKLMLEMKITTPRILPRFPTTSEMFPLKMMR